MDRLVRAIRSQDRCHLITIGEIPWAYPFPGAKPLFHSQAVGTGLDFVSVHFYPKKGDLENALRALAVYDVGKPLVVEEMFPLQCSAQELDQFIHASRHMVHGWFSFYWGKTIDEYARQNAGLAEAIMKNWLEFVRGKGPEILGSRRP